MFQDFTVRANPAQAARHLPRLRAEMARAELDHFIIPHADEYQNEYTPAYAQRLTWATGFTGSAGAAIIGRETAAMFTDGRYALQVRSEVDGALFSFHDISDCPPAAWLKANLEQGARVGFDPRLHSRAGASALERACAAAGGALIAMEANPVDAAWEDQPARPAAPLRPHPERLAGRSAADKRAAIAKTLQDKKADVAYLASPASIAWAFNVRGGDVAHTPLALARALVHADGSAELFVAPDKADAALAAHLGADVRLQPEEALGPALRALGPVGAEPAKRVLADPADASAWAFQELETGGAAVATAQDPCVAARAVKTEAEQAGTRAAHLRDGAALTRFLHWLSIEAPTGRVDEIGAVRQLEAFRRETNALKDVSFETISGSGPNGAIVHYRVNEATNRPLGMGELFLVDSGAQYEDGTTDVTRTIAIGAPTEEMRDRFTRVLKGHIAIARLRFPKGTTGAHIDALARAALWQAGLDYDHGTGHGVGSYLGVHEGPQSISKRLANVPLEPGMIVSNEPGYYKTDAYGIRIENLVLVRPPEPIDGGDRDMLSFETLTLAPIDPTLILPDMLTPDERDWLNAYHVRVRAEVGPLVGPDVATWLGQVTKAL